MDKKRIFKYNLTKETQNNCGDKMKNEEALKEILNGLNMGMLSIDYFEDKIQNNSFRDLVLKQRKDYGNLKTQLQKDFPEAEDVLKQKFMVETMLMFKTMMSDDKKIAKMMIEGCNQGIMTMNELLNEQNLSDKVQYYIHSLSELSHHYLQLFKPFL